MITVEHYHCFYCGSPKKTMIKCTNCGGTRNTVDPSLRVPANLYNFIRAETLWMFTNPGVVAKPVAE
jgi:hypothetical protein